MVKSYVEHPLASVHWYQEWVQLSRRCTFDPMIRFINRSDSSRLLILDVKQLGRGNLELELVQRQSDHLIVLKIFYTV